MENKQVRFIKVRGRVIPIRNKTDYAKMGRRADVVGSAAALGSVVAAFISKKHKFKFIAGGVGSYLLGGEIANATNKIKRSEKDKKDLDFVKKIMTGAAALTGASGFVSGVAAKSILTGKHIMSPKALKASIGVGVAAAALNIYADKKIDSLKSKNKNDYEINAIKNRQQILTAGALGAGLYAGLFGKAKVYNVLKPYTSKVADYRRFKNAKEARRVISGLIVGKK